MSLLKSIFQRKTARRIAWAWIAGLLWSLAAGQAVSEAQVKSVFLFNFAKFVEWPAESFKSPSDPYVICVAGENTLRGPLEEAVSGKTVAGRGLAIRRVLEPCRSCGCHILFIPASRVRTKSFLLEVQGTAVLTVGETDEFAEDGGVINFKLVDSKFRLEINAAGAERERIHISSKLLGVAQIVKKDGPRP